LHDGHVRVDIIYQRLGVKGQAWANLLGVVLLLTSWKFVWNAWAILEGSPDPGGIPLRFLVKGCIPAGFTLLLLQGISLGIRSVLQLAGLETVEEVAPGQENPI
jgi:TRAP-type mannitol/chloroaromatic compound transport system permease small subunit